MVGVAVGKSRSWSGCSWGETRLGKSQAGGGEEEDEQEGGFIVKGSLLKANGKKEPITQPHDTAAVA